MKIDKTLNTLLMFGALLVILITAYIATGIVAKNNVSSGYSVDLDMGGARLSDDVYAKMTKSSNWDTYKGIEAQYDFIVYNSGDFDLTNWKITIEVPKEAEIEDIWNADASMSSGKLELTPVYYDRTISSNSQIGFGLIASSKRGFNISRIHLDGFAHKSARFVIVLNIIGMMIAVLGVVFVGYLVTRFNQRNYKERQKNDVKIILQSMNTFISFIDAKDPYTRGHSKRVAMYAAEISKRMGLSDDEVQNIYYAGLLHDAGKISVPDAVLNKPGKLSDDERKEIQNHTVAGGKMLKQLTSLRGVRETALYHHERYDGKGYPEGLNGDAIPLYARIVGVADSYDAMSSNRVYRRHLTKDEIMDEMQKGAGSQFDPDIVKYMVDMINDGYVNVVKMETYEQDENNNFHIREEDITSLYMRI